MTTRFLLIVVVWALAIGPTFAGQPITDENWLAHPDILEVRTLYQKVQATRESGKLRKKERKFEYCEPYQDTERLLYTGADGKPRIYYYTGGSDDSAVEAEIYYDDSGTRRFAFIKAGAFNGTRLEHRVYFGKTGTKIWETQKRLEGSGYTFPSEWPDEELAPDAMQALNATNLCPEQK